jgi:hypothetical protein
LHDGREPDAVSACFAAELPTGKTVEAVCPQAVMMTELDVN